MFSRLHRVMFPQFGQLMELPMSVEVKNVLAVENWSGLGNCCLQDKHLMRQTGSGMARPFLWLDSTDGPAARTHDIA